MNKLKNILPLIIGFAIAIGVLIGSTLNYPNKTAMLFGNSPQEAKIKKLINFIEYDYVDNVDTDSILDGTIKDIVEKLDPHSVYIPTSEREKITEKMEGEFVGIGIQYRMVKDSLTVIQTTKNGPSEKAGLKAGDRILIAEKDTLFGKKIDSDKVVAKLKGPKKSKLKVTVYRKATKETLPFTIVRNTIPLHSVEAHYMLTNEIAYIKINSFTATTYKEFKTALIELKNNGAKKLVVDVRDNPGGYIKATTDIVDEFLKDNKLILFTKDKKGKVENSFATNKGIFENNKIYVLINENSASASEILAGALQDNDKGVIVGRRSFGKGLVQQDMKLGDGSSVRLTTARYYTPTGRSIQKPYELNKKADYYHDDFSKRFQNGELTIADSIKVVDSLRFKTPKGKIVYGGGGITPDVFVPIDTSNLFSEFRYDTLLDYVFEVIDNDRSKWNNMSFDEFYNDFDYDNVIYDDFVSRHFTRKVNNPEKVKHYLKAFFARELFDDTHFIQILNKDDKMIEKVLEIESEIEVNIFKD